VQRGGLHYAGNRANAGQLQVAPGDRHNNAEVVYLEPAGGPLIARVKAQSLPGDGIPYSGDATDQDYALLCHNCKSVAGFDAGHGTTQSSICTGDQALFTLPVAMLGPAGPIQASLSGVPAGATANLAPSMLNADGQFEVALSDTAGLAVGEYALQIDLNAAAFGLTQTLQLSVADSPPAAGILGGPTGDVEVSSLRPTLSWDLQAGADVYRLEVSLNADFSDPLVDLELQGDEYHFDTDLAAEATVYWRVTARNSCGSGQPTAASFRTPAAPGSCPAGTRKVLLFTDNLEPPDPDWSTVDEGGINTWQLSVNRSNSPTSSWKAIDSSLISDQKLDSPLLALPPATDRPVLSFRHWRNIERRSALECWDGAVIDLISSEGVVLGPSVDEFQLGGPRRVLAESNLSQGRPAWCGVTDFESVLLDLRDYADQSLRVRFRMLTDGGIGREGWYVDDVEVHSCVADGILFRSGMGAEPN